MLAQIVQYINAHRQEHGASPLLENTGLKYAAQKLANKLVKAGKIVYDNTTTHNHTVGFAKAQQNDAVRDIVSNWRARIQNYNWAEKKVNKDNQDFVIMIHRKTTHVGCGVARDAKGTVWVACMYSPKITGNDLVENVLPYTGMYWYK